MLDGGPGKTFFNFNNRFDRGETLLKIGLMRHRKTNGYASHNQAAEVAGNLVGAPGLEPGTR